jgi:hypothetical protein
LRLLAEFAAIAGVSRGGTGDDPAGEEAGACLGVSCPGANTRNFPGALRLRGVPAGSEHALSQDEADVLALADTKAYPQVHLGAHRALAHGFLRGPLSSGYQRDGYGGTKSGVVLTLFGLSQGKVRVPSGSNRRNRT